MHYLLLHVLCLKMIRNIHQGVWISAHYLFKHLFCLKTVWYKFQWVWLHTYCFVTHLLRFKMFWDLSYPAWNICKERHIYSYPEPRVKFYGRNADHNQRFLMTLIFVCAGCLAQQLKINHKYTTIKQWFSTKLHQIRTWLSRPLIFNDVFIVYLSMRRLSRTAIEDKP